MCVCVELYYVLTNSLLLVRERLHEEEHEKDRQVIFNVSHSILYLYVCI